MKIKDPDIGLKISVYDTGNCETCQLNKLNKVPCHKKAKDVLKIVRTDILGCRSPEAEGGHFYVTYFVYSFSRYRNVYFLKKRVNQKKV